MKETSITPENNPSGRPSDRFLLLSVIFSAVVVIFFVIVGFQTRRCHDDIVNLYCAEVVSPVDNVRLDKTIGSLLQLEVDKIQESMIVLSIWAGVMMIVFLVFSLYSMHRSDELEKEGRDLLRMMKQTSGDIKKEAEESIAQVADRSKEELEKIHEEIDQHKKDYDSMAASKHEELKNLYEKYSKALEKSTEDYKKGVESILTAIHLLGADVDESDTDKTDDKSR